MRRPLGVVGGLILLAACNNTPPRSTTATTANPTTTITTSTTMTMVAPRGPGEVRFVRYTDAEIYGSVWAASPDGGGERRLFPTPHRDQLLAFAPDGSRYAFRKTTSDRDGTSLLFVADADGANERQLTFAADVQNRDLRWSPDGTRLVYSKRPVANPASWELVVINADGTGERRLTSFPAGEGFPLMSTGDLAPTFSPDGQTVAFQREGSTDRGLFSVRTDGTGLRRLSSIALLQPDWSPDGATIVAVQGRDFGQDIVLVDVATTARRALTGPAPDAERESRCRLGRANERNTSPHFSPDGTQILYTSNRNHLLDDGLSEELVIVPVAGGVPRNITSHPPACRADGTGRTKDNAIDWLG